MDLIRECAENVASHWQQLMLKMEDRLKLVNASVAFYKTSEQVKETAALTLCYGFIKHSTLMSVFVPTGLQCAGEPGTGV